MNMQQGRAAEPIFEHDIRQLAVRFGLAELYVFRSRAAEIAARIQGRVVTAEASSASENRGIGAALRITCTTRRPPGGSERSTARTLSRNAAVVRSSTTMGPLVNQHAFRPDAICRLLVRCRAPAGRQASLPCMAPQPLQPELINSHDVDALVAEADNRLVRGQQQRSE